MRDGFTIHHNGPPARCLGQPHTRCIAFWNAVRDFHVNAKGWSGIAYSFGMCPHGIRFVGQGWDRAQFANGEDIVGPEDGSDSHWYTVLVFLGWEPGDDGPVDEEPTPEMVAGVRTLIAEGRSSGRCGTRVLPHNAFKPKRCPGAEFTALAAAWDNRPLTTGDDDVALSDDDKQWLRDLMAIATGDRTSVDGEARSDVWRWDRETVTIIRALKGEVAALRSAVGQLGAGGSVDYSKVKEAVKTALREGAG